MVLSEVRCRPVPTAELVVLANARSAVLAARVNVPPAQGNASAIDCNCALEVSLVHPSKELASVWDGRRLGPGESVGESWLVLGKSDLSTRASLEIQ